MAIELIETSGDLVRDAVAATVFVRPKWLDAWQETPYLCLNQCEWCASPRISSAELEWQYGEGQRQGKPGNETVDPLAIEGWWVKIAIPQVVEGEENPDDLLWYGRVVRIDRSPTSAPGTQTVFCEGMESLLTHQTIETSWVDNSPTPAAPPAKKRVFSGLEFNPPKRSIMYGGETFPLHAGNRSYDPGPDGVALFAGPDINHLQTAQAWSSREILRYLLKYHSPQNGLGNEPLSFAPHADATQVLPDWDSPRIPTHGRSLKRVLDALMSRERGLSYVVELEEASSLLYIRPFSFFDEEITLPSAEVLHANQNQKQIDVFAAIDLAEATISTVETGNYHQVKAVGARPIVCATLKASDGSIVADWLEESENDYRVACSGEAWYAALDSIERMQRNRDYRAQEEFEQVYSWFSSDQGWPENPGSGESWSNPIPSWLYAELGLDTDEDNLVYRPTLHFLPKLPLRTDADYSGSQPENYHTTSFWGANWGRQKYEYRRPLVAIKLNDDLSSTSGKYVLVDKMPACAGVEGTGKGPGRAFGCTVQMQSHAPGFVLKVHGAPQHAIAYDDFDQITSVDYGEACPEYDWNDDLVATVAFELDYEVQSIYPALTDLSISGSLQEALRIKRIDASARCRLDFLCPNTVVDIDKAGDLVLAPSQFLRDDRGTLSDLARLAYEWYCCQRQTLALRWKQAQNAGLFRVGDLVLKIGQGDSEEDIRTVITSRKVTMGRRANETHTTMIRTSWAELDFLQLI